MSHHGTDGLFPVRSLSGMYVSQFRHNVVVLQVASWPQAPTANKYGNLVLHLFPNFDANAMVENLREKEITRGNSIINYRCYYLASMTHRKRSKMVEILVSRSMRQATAFWKKSRFQSESCCEPTQEQSMNKELK